MDEKELNRMNQKEKEVLNLIKKEIYSYNKKYVNIEEGCAYFIIDNGVYGFCILKGEDFDDIPFIWLEDAEYKIKESEGPDLLFKGPTHDYMLLDYESLLELYTLINIEKQLAEEE